MSEINSKPVSDAHRCRQAYERHTAEAERLVSQGPALVAEAQVHATLAAAAVTMAAAYMRRSDTGTAYTS